MFRDVHCSQLDEHNNEVNTYLPRDKSRYNAPPDWLKTAMVPKVPSLQLAKTEVLTPYTLHLTLTLTLTLTLSAADREFFCIRHSSRGTILCRLASRASSLGWLVGNYPYWTGTSLQWRLMRRNIIKKRLMSLAVFTLETDNPCEGWRWPCFDTDPALHTSLRPSSLNRWLPSKQIFNVVN